MRRRSGLDRVAVDWVVLELMRVAYATRGGFLAVRDPRAVVWWYLIGACAPWFTDDAGVLAVLFTAALAAASAARIGPLLLGLFLLGVAGDLLYLLVMLLVLREDPATVVTLVVPVLKLGTVSLVGMAAFASLDPEKVADALLALRAPPVLGFAVSYGYRMIPVLVDEFRTIVDGHLLRGAPPRGPGFLGLRAAARAAAVLARSFYPLVLNTARRTRTTAEALETRGFTAAGPASGRARALRLAHLRFGPPDAVLLAATLAVVVLAYGAGPRLTP